MVMMKLHLMVRIPKQYSMLTRPRLLGLFHDVCFLAQIFFPVVFASKMFLVINIVSIVPNDRFKGKLVLVCKGQNLSRIYHILNQKVRA